MKKIFLVCVVLWLAGSSIAVAQTPPPATVYPKVVGYMSFVVPAVTINKNETTPEFKKATTIGFPTGVNILFSDKFGFSFELAPFIAAQASGSKTSNILFHPGPMFRFKHGFTFISRLAFETQGRYGFTPVFNQIFKRTKAINYFVAASTPVRFGNNAPASIGASFQLGFLFN